jgi:hypothetical protein
MRCKNTAFFHFDVQGSEIMRVAFNTIAFSVPLWSMKIWIFILLPVFFCVESNAQESPDTLPYSLYKDRVILFSDLGFSAAPFTLKDNFSEGQEKLKYKHNLKLSLGLGVMYKWFSLRIGFGLPGTLRPKSRFGNTQITDLGLTFNFKKTFWDIDGRNYYGYSIVDANHWNDTLNNLTPNLIRPTTRALSFSTNVWYFQNKHFKMPAVIGKVGHYNTAEKTWYLKGTLNFFGISNEAKALAPVELIDTTQTKSSAHTIAAVDIGVVPGYAYVGRINHWQFSAFGGLGAVIQSKIYTVGQSTKGLLGLAPRLDLRFIVGYSKPDYFVWFVTDFDVKSIRFQEMRYNQTFYSLKVVAGVRLKKKIEGLKD